MRHHHEMREREAAQAREADREEEGGSPGQGSWAGCHQEGEIPLLYSIDLEY
jgi:U3 small nucleolar RNA-associated protein 14